MTKQFRGESDGGCSIIPAAIHFVPPSPERARGAGLIGSPPVGAAEDEHLDQLVEDHPIRNPGAVALERMGVQRGWQQDAELVPDGVDDG